MESKEYITYARRTKAEARTSFFKNDNQFYGYRSTKQWIEEASQQYRGRPIDKVEQQQPQKLYQSGRAPRRLNKTLWRTTSRKKDERSVHFKKENDGTASQFERKVGTNQTSSLSPAIIVRKDALFFDGQAAALSPISLNVAVGGRQVATSLVPAKMFAADATMLKRVPQAQGQTSVVSPEGRAQSLPSGRNEEGRQVVWCNAAFEVEDDLRSHKSQDSARSNRYSMAGCSKQVDSDFSGPENQKQDQETWASRTSNVDVNPSAMISLEKISDGPATISGSAPATLMGKFPEQISRLPYVSELELESAAGERYTPMGSEAGESSRNSRNLVKGNEKPTDQSKSRKTMAAPASFKTAPALSHANRQFVGVRGTSTTCTNSRKYPKYFTEVPSHCGSEVRSNSNPRVCISYDNGPGSVRRSGGLPVLAGKMDPPRYRTPKIQRVKEDPMVEEDLEADIEHQIEQEISMEISQLSERLAALHARQETRRVAGGVGQERPKSSGISCPQTPTRNAHSPCGSCTTKKRKVRPVAAKFLQCTNDGTHAARDKSANRSERPAAKILGFSDGPFLGRPNPPRRSLGTPSRLLAKSKPTGQQKIISPNDMVKDRTVCRPADSEEQTRGIGENTVPYEDYVRNRAMLENSSDKRVARVSPHKNLGEEDRKEWNDRGFGQQAKKDNQPATTLCTGSTTVQQPHFYPEFDRKVDWVKTLRTDPIPIAHLCVTTNSPSSALDERFLKQKSERQDVRAWLRENVGVAEGNYDNPNFPPHASGTGYEVGLQRGVQADVAKMGAGKEEGSTSTMRPSNARTATWNRCIPYPPTTPSQSQGHARTVASCYGTPVKVMPARDPGSKSCDPKPFSEKPGSQTCCSLTTPDNRCSKDTKGGVSMRKASPIFGRGYPAECVVRNKVFKGREVGALRDEQEPAYNNQEERKITVVEAEYEKFVQGSVQIDKRGPVIFTNTVVEGGLSVLATNHELRSNTPSFPRHRDMPDTPAGTAMKPAKTTFIRFCDLINDNHPLLVKGKRRSLAQQSRLPSERPGSEDSVSVRSSSMTGNLPELDGYNSTSEDASIIEESTNIKNCQHSQRRDDQGGMPFSTGLMSCKSSEPSTRDYDVVYDFESGNARGSSYRPDDYTLEMMLQYVDTLKCERESLPRIRAGKDGVTDGGGSLRDSGCIKRRKGEKRARFFFDAGGEANKVQVPRRALVDNDGFFHNEIEELYLESFWCSLVDPSPI